MQQATSITSDEDEAAFEWMNAVNCEWSAEISDSREDIYSLADGTPVANAATFKST
jgi:hypothetical protein